MKSIYLIRHAKSSWSDFSLKDIDRPLNKRGKRDAPFMGNLLYELGVQPDAIISSPANRAYTTACHFAKALAIPTSQIIREAAIYEAHTSTILRIICTQPDQYQTILLFGHNPTFTAVANMFADSPIYNMPTCGIAQIEAEIDTWKDFDESRGKMVAFHYPKQYFTKGMEG